MKFRKLREGVSSCSYLMPSHKVDCPSVGSDEGIGVVGKLEGDTLG